CCDRAVQVPSVPGDEDAGRMAEECRQRLAEPNGVALAHEIELKFTHRRGNTAARPGKSAHGRLPAAWGPGGSPPSCWRGLPPGRGVRLATRPGRTRAARQVRGCPR